MVVDRPESGADAIVVQTANARRTVLELKGEYLDSPVYSSTGHLLYHRETTVPGIWAVPFSLERLETTGDPFLAIPQGLWPTVGENGLLLYAGSELSGDEDLAWFDIASGGVTPALKAAFPAIGFPRLSPDGTRVAALVREADLTYSVIVADLQRHSYVRLAGRAIGTSRPAWKDNDAVVYEVDAGQASALALRRADASEPQISLFRGIQPFVGRGGRLLFVRLEAGQGGGLWHTVLNPGAGPVEPPTLFQQTPFHESEPALSPDGTLLAYTRGNQGQSDVVVRRYPQGPGLWNVSGAGGLLPQWSPSGDKLYYRDQTGQIHVVDVHGGREIRLGSPRAVPRPANLIARTGFDISRDGKQILLTRQTQPEGARGPRLTVVQNWLAASGRSRANPDVPAR
jgi:hypothetical protein